MRTLYLGLLCYFFIIQFISCQKQVPEVETTTKISGRVTNSLDEGIYNAELYFKLDGNKVDYQAITDKEGYYTINNVPLGGAMVQVHKNLYDTLSTFVRIAIQEQILNAKLTASKLDIPTITINNNYSSIELDINFDNTKETFKNFEIYENNDIIDETSQLSWKFHPDNTDEFHSYRVRANNIDNISSNSHLIWAKISNKPYFSAIGKHDSHFNSPGGRLIKVDEKYYETNLKGSSLISSGAHKTNKKEHNFNLVNAGAINPRIKCISSKTSNVICILWSDTGKPPLDARNNVGNFISFFDILSDDFIKTVQVEDNAYGLLFINNKIFLPVDNYSHHKIVMLDANAENPEIIEKKISRTAIASTILKNKIYAIHESGNSISIYDSNFNFENNYSIPSMKEGTRLYDDGESIYLYKNGALDRKLKLIDQY